jgi:hypothetical protein
MIEADFRREYGVSLIREFETMSWREFAILLNNLSTDSIYAQVKHMKKTGQIPVELDEVQSDRLVNSFF